MSRVERLKSLPAGPRPGGKLLVGAGWLCLLCAVSPPQAVAQHRHPPGRHTAAPSEAHRRQASTGRPGVIEIGAARLAIPDVEVLDQDGRKVRFYTDLIKGKTVIVNFFFTSCTFTCPRQGRALAKLRAELAGRLGRDVFFVSVSRDPETDTPERLKRWGADYGVGPGWALVTGEKGVMSNLVRDFTGEGLSREIHSPILLVGNDRTGVWTEAGGLSSPDTLVKVIDRVAEPAAVRSGILSP